MVVQIRTRCSAWASFHILCSSKPGILKAGGEELLGKRNNSIWSFLWEPYLTLRERTKSHSAMRKREHSKNAITPSIHVVTRFILGSFESQHVGSFWVPFESHKFFIRIGYISNSTNCKTAEYIGVEERDWSERKKIHGPCVRQKV